MDRVLKCFDKIDTIVGWPVKDMCYNRTHTRDLGEQLTQTGRIFVETIRDAETSACHQRRDIKIQTVMSDAEVNPVRREKRAFASQHIRKFNIGKKRLVDGTLNEMKKIERRAREVRHLYTPAGKNLIIGGHTESPLASLAVIYERRTAADNGAVDVESRRPSFTPENKLAGSP